MSFINDCVNVLPPDGYLLFADDIKIFVPISVHNQAYYIAFGIREDSLASSLCSFSYRFASDVPFRVTQMRLLPASVFDILTRATLYRCQALKSYKVPPSSVPFLNKPSSSIMNPTHSANHPQSSKEYHVPVKKLHSLSLNQPQSTTSERFFVKQP